MQKVQNLSHPWMIGTWAVTAGWPGTNGPTQPSGSTPALSPTMRMSGSNCWGCMKTSTYGNRARSSSLFGPTMQPMSARVTSGLRSFHGLRLVSMPTTRSSAFCRTTQELRMMTSASLAVGVHSRPSCSKPAPSRSESALFI